MGESTVRYGKESLVQWSDAGLSEVREKGLRKCIAPWGMQRNVESNKSRKGFCAKKEVHMIILCRDVYALDPWDQNTAPSRSTDHSTSIFLVLKHRLA